MTKETFKEAQRLTKDIEALETISTLQICKVYEAQGHSIVEGSIIGFSDEFFEEFDEWLTAQKTNYETQLEAL